MTKSANLKGPGLCIFCGRTGLSKEHIWSEWTYALVPRVKDGEHFKAVLQSAKDDPKIRRYESVIKRQGSTNTIKLKVVCKTHCNNGWMSRLDERAKPILSPLIMGQPRVLNENDLRIIATWSAMKMMVTEFSLTEDLSSHPSEREYLMNHHEPPSNWRIWIAKIRSDKWRQAYYRNSALLGHLNETGVPVPHKGSLRKNTQAISIGIGELFISAVSTTVPGLMFDAPTDAQRHIRQIWPITGDLLWPPGTALTTGAADLFADSFARFMTTLNWTPHTGFS